MNKKLTISEFARLLWNQADSYGCRSFILNGYLLSVMKSLFENGENYDEGISIIRTDVAYNRIPPEEIKENDPMYVVMWRPDSETMTFRLPVYCSGEMVNGFEVTSVEATLEDGEFFFTLFFGNKQLPMYVTDSADTESIAKAVFGD